jgi:FkbM family methyltransferase
LILQAFEFCYPINLLIMIASVKKIVRAALRRFDLKLVRMSVDDQKIGMEICIKGLAKRDFIPNVVLDIGAATGQWTRLALKYWPGAKYFLVEPLEERRTALDRLCQEHPNVSYILAAAGAAAGELPIGILPDQLDGSSFLYGDVHRTVPVEAIDDLLDAGRIEPPQFMKLDVQGYELEVLKGAGRALESCPLVLLELEFFRFTPSMKLVHESIEWMVLRGFRPYEIVDILRRPYDGAMGQCDILFVREDHWLAGNNAWA